MRGTVTNATQGTQGELAYDRAKSSMRSVYESRTSFHKEDNVLLIGCTCVLSGFSSPHLLYSWLPWSRGMPQPLQCKHFSSGTQSQTDMHLIREAQLLTLRFPLSITDASGPTPHSRTARFRPSACGLTSCNSNRQGTIGFSPCSTSTG